MLRRASPDHGSRPHRRTAARRTAARSAVGILAAAALAVSMGVTPTEPAAEAATSLPSGFQDTTVMSGLAEPTNVEFAPDGRVFVAEKRGVVMAFDSLSDSSPVVAADMRTQTFNYLDRGLLGMALDPGFPSRPYLYVAYTLDAKIGGTPPRWGTAGANDDECPTPPGANTDGCLVGGRVSRLTLSGNQVTAEKVLVEDWCQQFSTHSIGTVTFGSDGALYAGGGDGASFNYVDYGQDGHPESDATPDNPCGDPPSPVGTALSAPTAEGGSLRSQDLRTSGDPLGLDGTIIRIDPDTGAGLPDNPRASSSDANVRRVIATGLRNPFRFTVRPGTDEVWVGDVGWKQQEEINRLADPRGTVDNFGWPCYEGAGRQGGYEAAGLTMCNRLYDAGPSTVTTPYHHYAHTQDVVPGEPCGRTNGSSTSGVAFYEGGAYPADYDGALFFADYARGCIWAMQPGEDGLPDPDSVHTFVSEALPVELQTGPGGDLFYVDITGSLHRVSYSAGNAAPTARITTTPAPPSGSAPLTVRFDASTSTDPNGDPLSYAWDLDGDGQFDDSFAASPSRTYTGSGPVTVRLRVDDGHGGLNSTTTTVLVDAHAPQATISSPTGSLAWRVGQVISFSGEATDPEDGALPASALTWTLVQQHCPDDCHSHVVRKFEGVASGSFAAPDHEYPSHLELHLTATDSDGLPDSEVVRLDPRTVNLTVESSPPGRTLALGDTVLPAPFVRTVIAGSANSLAAPSPQRDTSGLHEFLGWSDGGARTHNVTAPDTSATYTASFASTPPAVFVPVAPTRLMNTATGYHTTRAKIGAGGTRDLTLAGRFGVPSDATSAVVTLTTRNATTSTALKAYPSGTSTPTPNTLYAKDSRATATSTVVKLGSNGALRLRNSNGSTDVSVDLQGYYLPRSPGTTYAPLTPTRLINTATGFNTTKAKISAGGTRDITLAGNYDVPTDATAAVVTLTARNATTSTALKAYPGGTASPDASVLHAHNGRALASTTVVKIGSNGAIRVRNTAGSVDVVADLQGYYLPRSPGTTYTPLAPKRLINTTTGFNTSQSKIGAGDTRDIALAGSNGVPGDATAAVVTLTSRNATTSTALKAYPSDASTPTPDTLYAHDGRATATTTVVKIGSNGAIRLRNSNGSVDVVADLQGYVR
ncbi:MAG: PQQ-dependent sugar dehydrogenase [Actinomycetes bacterium]